jgi:putative aldouronate transport system permease protein
MAKIFETRSDKIFTVSITVFLILVALLAAYPILNITATSFSSGFMAERGKVFLLPLEFNLDSWQRIMRDATLWRALYNSVVITVFGTAASLLFTAVFAYSLANKNNRIKSIISGIIIFTMVFRYPLIPYFLAVRSYGLIDKLSVMVFTHLLVAYNLIIMKTFFKQLPDTLEESAVMEGAGHLTILFKIVLPLSKPVMATLGLFYAVTYWNLFLHPLLFIRSDELYPLQTRLRALLDQMNSIDNGNFNASDVKFSPATVRAAVIMFATVPILMVYPFVQKYFVKGAMLGSVKG